MQDGETLHVRVTRRAMATRFEVFLHRDAPSCAVEAAVVALDGLERIEQCLTIYSPTSELSRVNRQAGVDPVFVSDTLWDVLQGAEVAYRATGGAFDVTAGPLIDAWGITSRGGRRPGDAEISNALQRVGWEHVQLNAESREVRFAQTGMRINLGAIGKGYAIDLISKQLMLAGAADFLIHGGSSSVAARGEGERWLPAGPQVGGVGEETNGRHGWRIGLRHPTREQWRLGGIRLIDRALATSGSGKQFFHFQGKRLGHVIDPRTGYPVDHFLSLTVVAGQAMLADALATGLYVAGVDGIERLMAEMPDVGVLAVLPGERVGETEVRAWNLPDGVWEPLCD